MVDNDTLKKHMTKLASVLAPRGRFVVVLVLVEERYPKWFIYSLNILMDQKRTNRQLTPLIIGKNDHVGSSLSSAWCVMMRSWLSLIYSTSGATTRASM